MDPPWKPTTPGSRRGVFEGDAAAVELRSRLATTRDSPLLSAPRDSLVPASRATVSRGILRFAGIILTAAAVAGAAGYLAGGVRLSFKPARIAAPFGEAETPAPAQLNSSNRRSGLPAAPTAAIDVTPAGARRAGGEDTAAARAAPWSGPPATPSISPPPLPPLDASETAARLKLGADLMTAGDVAAARTMFARIAEAGDPAGAFALAETYDPAVLGTMRLRGGIIPDPAQARRWYEKARELGSSAAPERIARLTGR